MYVAVYGTLKKNKGNHVLLEKAKFIQEMMITGFRLYVAGLPYVCFSGLKKDKVKVEIYEINDIILNRLDRLEGHPHFYERQPISIGEDREAWIYLYKEKIDDKYMVPSGVYA